MEVENKIPDFVFQTHETQAFLAYSLSSYSCILDMQELVDATGQPNTAKAVLGAFRRGERIDLMVDPLGIPGRDDVATVIAACATKAQAVEVVLTDGRSVRLTVGHALPHQASRPGSGCVLSTIISGRPEMIVEMGDGDQLTYPRIPPLRVGDEIGDGIVAEIHDLGRRTAVRLWVDGPEFLLTPQGMRIGTRFHEVAASVDIVYPVDEEELNFFPRTKLHNGVVIGDDELLVQADQEFYDKFGGCYGSLQIDPRASSNERNMRSAYRLTQNYYNTQRLWRRYGSEAYRIGDDHTNPTEHDLAIKRQAFRLGKPIPQSVDWWVSKADHRVWEERRLPQRLTITRAEEPELRRATAG